MTTATRKNTFHHTATIFATSILALALSGAFAGSANAADPFEQVLQQSVATNFTAPVVSIARSEEHAQPAGRKWKKAWIASWVAFAVVNALDAHSSQGRREANPLLRGNNGQFSNGKAALIKGALGGGFFAWQVWTARKHPEVNYYKTFTLSNTAVTGGLGLIAARNYSLPSIQTTPAATPLPDHLRRVD